MRNPPFSSKVLDKDFGSLLPDSVGSLADIQNIQLASVFEFVAEAKVLQLRLKNNNSNNNDYSR